MPERFIGAAGSGRPTAHDIATRMLAFSQTRLAAFAAYDMVVNDVAWDLLLSLFIAHERGRRVTVQKLCDAVPLPGAVTLRWVLALRTSGLLRYNDQEGMAAQVRLTPAADGVVRGLIEA
ncbi:hypothetical protein [Sphingomonas sp. PB4P5]|uniref:hypothetical protein n=1 Tax=Parasphingomonas puruogangriensis TaxID=3096155 RepID=UPI002FC7994A